MKFSFVKCKRWPDQEGLAGLGLFYTIKGALNLKLFGIFEYYRQICCLEELSK